MHHDHNHTALDTLGPPISVLSQQCPALFLLTGGPSLPVLRILPRLGVNENGEGAAEDRPRDGEERIERDGVVAQRAVGERVQGGLDELARARDADDGAVDAAEGGKAEDLGGIVSVFRFGSVSEVGY